MPNLMPHRTLLLLTVSFPAVAGCEIDFGSGDSDGDIQCEDIDVGDEVLIDSVLYVGNSIEAYGIEIIDD